MKRFMQLVFLLLMVFMAVSVFAGGEKEGATTGVTEIRAAWWGSVARHEKFNAIFDLYEQRNPNIKVIRESANWGDYWDRTATQAAGRNLPDMTLNVMMFIRDYASKGVLHPLDNYTKNGTINISDWDKGTVDAGVVNGKLYMLTIGDTATGMIINKDIVARAGMEMPPNPISWQQFAVYAKELKQRLPANTWVTIGSYEHVFESYIRSLGYQYTTEDGKALGFPKEAIRDYWAYWQDLSKAGVVPPADILAEEGNRPWEDHMLTKGRIAIHFMNANQAKIYQMYQKEDQLVLVRNPYVENAVHKWTEQIQPSAWAIAENSRYKDLAAAGVNYWINDKDAHKIFNLELGVPGNPDVRKMLIEALKPDEKKTDRVAVQEIELLGQIGATAIPTFTRHARVPAVHTAWSNIYTELDWGRITLDEAVENFYREGNRLLQE